MDNDLAPGTMVGAYRVEKLLGAGGVGAVYAAEEPTIKKRVAIKVLRRSVAGDSAAAARFEREARAANEVRHPGIVEVFALGTLPDGRPYLVMSLLEGRSLRDELTARGKLPPGEAWSIVHDVAEALAAAHDKGIIHRDLKPDNVFLERFAGERPDAPAHVRLLDFGIAKLAAPEGEAPMRLTATGAPIGTPVYMAPEQWWGEGIDARTDQYALGAMLFELCAGRPPFDSKQFVELLQRHVHEAPPSLAATGIEVTEAVEDLVRRLLAKAGKDRFASMREVIEAGDRAFSLAATARVGVEERVEAPAESLSTAPTMLTPPIELVASRATDAVRFDPLPADALPVDPAPAIVAEPSPTPARVRALPLAILALGPLALIAVGYAGRARRDVREWFLQGGWGQNPVALSFLVGAIALVIMAGRRRASPRAKRAGFVIAMLPALFGAFATYTGWHAIHRGLSGASSIDHFAIFNQGTYEANTCRFLGFALSATLLLVLSTSTGAPGASSPGASAPSAAHRGETLAIAAGLALLCVLAITLGAPSGALIAGAGAAAIGLSALVPAHEGEAGAHEARAQAFARVLAVGLVALVGLTRVEAREAVLWVEQPTRAERVAEILSAHGEHDATWPIAVIALGVLLAVEVRRLARIARADRAAILARPRPASLALVAALALAFAGDQAQHARFTAKHDALRATIAAPFALFSRLDPPQGEALDPARFSPHKATAVQITRDAVAIDGKGIARLAALDSREGTAQIAADLNHALAAVSVADGEPSETDLLLTVDRHVKGATVRAMLQIARSAGVSRAEVLLTRGATPKLPLTGPSEIFVVIPGDFVALPVTLGASGLSLDPGKTFEELAPSLAAAALGRDGAVPLTVDAPSTEAQRP
ncbi:MAG: serine/threonine-protein kinase [Byssovorax sp.]